MIVYVTRPYNHEVAMGGWRDFIVWTEEPHFHHFAVKSDPLPQFLEQNPKAWWKDRGWTAGGRGIKSNARFKPLVRQDSTLEENAWQLVIWACAPKSANLSISDAAKWSCIPLPGEDPDSEWCKTNWDTLLYHHNTNSDAQSNVHHRRFLMKVNLVTRECELIDPMVHFYPTQTDERVVSVRTKSIEEPYMSRTYFASEYDDTYNDLPF